MLLEAFTLAMLEPWTRATPQGRFVDGNPRHGRTEGALRPAGRAFKRRRLAAELGGKLPITAFASVAIARRIMLVFLARPLPSHAFGVWPGLVTSLEGEARQISRADRDVDKAGALVVRVRGDGLR
jgi:hypothetical protein